MSFLRNTSFFFLILLCISCSRYITSDTERGSTYKIEYGVPAFTVNATPRVIDDSITVAKLYISLVKNSLIYKLNKGALLSSAEILLNINGENRQVVPVHILKEESDDYYTYESLMIEEVIHLEPGEYTINVTVIDNNSTKKRTEKAEIYIPSIEDEEIFLSDVLLYHKVSKEASFKVRNSHDINEGFDSLRFEYQILSSLGKSLEVRARLLKYESDNKIPRRLSERNYRSSSLEYKGIDYGEYKIISKTTRKIKTPGNIIIQYHYGSLPPGNYRFEAISSNRKGRSYRARDFSIKSKNYPSLKTAKEIAKPLVYLMTKKEYKRLLKIQSPDSLIKSVERFWLNKMHSKVKAKNVLQLYYERVEQANQLYSNFQEGWKTDPGMIYILFGKPLYIEKGFGEMTWYYSFDSGTRTPHIYFKDVHYGNTNFPFQHYVLKRSPELFSLEYKQIQAWLDGTILHLHQM